MSEGGDGRGDGYPRAHTLPSIKCVTDGAYDICGATFLWWTWHTTDQAISNRLFGAPIGSTMWILTYCGLQCYLMRSFLNAGLGSLFSVPAAMLATTPLFMTLMGQLQMLYVYQHLRTFSTWCDGKGKIENRKRMECHRPRLIYSPHEAPSTPWASRGSQPSSLPLAPLWPSPFTVHRRAKTPPLSLGCWRWPSECLVAKVGKGKTKTRLLLPPLPLLGAEEGAQGDRQGAATVTAASTTTAMITRAQSGG